jgi:hypothetical protein
MNTKCSCKWLQLTIRPRYLYYCWQIHLSAELVLFVYNECNALSTHCYHNFTLHYCFIINREEMFLLSRVSLWLSALSVCVAIYLSVKSVYLSICLSICLSTYLALYLSVCLSICLSVSLSPCLAMSLSVYVCLCLSGAPLLNELTSKPKIKQVCPSHSDSDLPLNSINTPAIPNKIFRDFPTFLHTNSCIVHSNSPALLPVSPSSFSEHYHLLIIFSAKSLQMI